MVGKADLQRMKDAALSAQSHSYSPYSGYAVGAALLTDDGRVFAGTNVENAAYPLGSCAEAGALSALVLAGKGRVVAAVIASPDDKPCTPCGGCRQRLAEFGSDDMDIYGINKAGDILFQERLGALLPLTFRLNPSAR